MSFPYRGGVDLSEHLFYEEIFRRMHMQDSTERPNVPIITPYAPEPLPVKPPTEDIPFISPGPSDNYILPRPPKPEPFLSREDWERFFSLLRPSGTETRAKREITVTTPKKLRFLLVVSLKEPREKIDESLLKKEFEKELRFRAPSWEITCTRFVIEGGMYKRGGYYYGIAIDLVVQPRIDNVSVLRFVPNHSNLFEQHFGMGLDVMSREERMELVQQRTTEVIVFNEVMKKIFNVPSASVYWEYVYMDEITGTLSPGVLVYSEVSPAIIHWGDLIKPQPLPITPQPSPVKPPPVEIPVEPQPVTPVTATPVGGMVPVNEEKKDEKTKKAFPWWIVIVVVVVALFFMMKK